MSQNASFIRKVAYIVAIVLLLYPLFMLGQPAWVSERGETRPGGWLAQLRTKYQLSQANLGDIDPASESIKLATLGMRGVAANALWMKADEYKKKQDWDNLAATLNQITKLQPNFNSVWEFQAHNMAYNVSVEFDDYRHRYHWVKRGVEFLVDGTHYNRNDTFLTQRVGWYISQKIGRSDERVQFRRMFRDDTDFHDRIKPPGFPLFPDGYGPPPNQKPDNWLVGRLWFLEARDMVDSGKATIRRMSPTLFYSYAPMARINHVADFEPVQIGELSQEGWKKAGDEWNEFGNLDLPTSFGHRVRLNDYEAVNDEIFALQRQLDALAPGMREKIHQEKLAKLTDEEREALNTTPTLRDQRQWLLFYGAEGKLKVTHLDVAARVPAEHQEEAQKISDRIDEKKILAQRIDSYRGRVNYWNWQTRCRAEQTDNAVAARKLVFEAEDAYYKRSDFFRAREKYEEAWKVWAKIFDEFPSLVDDDMARDLMKAVNDYATILSQFNERLPSDFPLQAVVERHSSELQNRGFFDMPALDPTTGQPGVGGAGEEGRDQTATTNGNTPTDQKSEDQKSEDQKSEDQKTNVPKTDGHSDENEKTDDKS